MNKTTYNGSDIFPGACGLYAYDSDSPYDFDYLEVLEEAKEIFTKDYLPQINRTLEIAGLKCVDFTPFIPREFNFMDSALDPVLIIEDEDKLHKYLTTNKIELQKALDANKSYDGFIATTEENIEEEIKACIEYKKEYTPDVLIIKHLLKEISTEVTQNFDLNECIMNVGTYIEECSQCHDQLDADSNGEMCNDCHERNKQPQA